MNKFYQPTDVKQLSEALCFKDENTFYIAGGTDVIIELRQDKIFDNDFIDLTKIKELNFIKDDGENVEIGSIVKIQEIADSEIIKDNFPSLAYACRHIGSKQIRNLATIGGNTCNASHSADTLPVLFSLGALAQIVNSKGEFRVLSLDDLIIGSGKTNLEKDEVMTKVIIPKKTKLNFFAKLGSRKEVTISKINCSASFDMDARIIKNVSMYVGAIGIKPIKANGVEQYLNGKNIEDIKEQELYDVCFELVEQAIPNRESKYYKRHAVCGVVNDVLDRLKAKVD